MATTDLTPHPTITHHLAGGLGNQLFQIFTTIATAKDNGLPFFFTKKDKLGIQDETIRPTYWNNLLADLSPYLKEPLNDPPPTPNEIPKFAVWKEPAHKYNPIILTPIHADRQYILNGFFQSYKYFAHHHKHICEITGIYFAIEKEKMVAKTQYPQRTDRTITIHFRLGDYVKLPDYHPILPIDYYAKSITCILENADEPPLNVDYYCEIPDEPTVIPLVEKLRGIFPFLRFKRGGAMMPDWRQMLQMSLCKYNIIANSTFSWWGAFLNENPGRIVCYPDVWFGQALSGYDTQDMFPPDWACISAK
jgi:hypothetical protein